jgi:hypothetical protein
MQAQGRGLSTVIAGPDPAIHDAIYGCGTFITDARGKPGHDAE